jgi:tetratricopeptide (TPR) repeat protein
MSERMQERMNFSVELTGEDRAEVVLRWEKMRVSFGISTDLKALAMDNINQYFHSAKADWYTHHNAASYLLTNGGSTAEALRLATRTVELNPEHFMAHYTKARALAATGNINEALASARQSLAVGEAKTSDWFEMTRPEIEASIKAWIIPGGGIKKK